jgi:uncharacterized membrane protein YfcA
LGVDPLVAVALALVAGLAGFVDAVAGGGGLLQLPALLAALGGTPQTAPVALGVNKVSSICGTSAAVVRYARHGSVRWDRLLVVGPLAFACSLVGTLGFLQAVKEAAEVVLPAFAVCFLALAVYQAWRAARPAPPETPVRNRPAVGLAFVAAIGLYDGFVGPGTGVLLFWAFTTWFALPALEATGTTKAVNWLANAGALTVFVAKGTILWPLALSMAGANLVGGWLGAHAAIRRGVAFIRGLTALVSAAAAVYLLLR